MTTSPSPGRVMRGPVGVPEGIAGRKAMDVTRYSRILFFFFQAEDGIRDLTVTGVQTCALPISASPLFVSVVFDMRPSALHLQAGRGRSQRNSRDAAGRTVTCVPRAAVWLSTARSEERRVGKEGRSRWSPYHLKKKKTEEGQHHT